MSNTQDPNKDRHLELLFHLEDGELRIATDILALHSFERVPGPENPKRRISSSVLDTRVGHQVQQVDDELGMPPLPAHADTPQSGLEEVAPSLGFGFQHVVGWGPSTFHDLMILKVVGRL